MSNNNVQRASRNQIEKQKSSGLPLRLARLNEKTKAATGQWEKFGGLAAEKGRTIRERTQNPLLWNKQKKIKEKTRLVPPWFRPGGGQRGQCAAGGVTPSRPNCRWFWEASRSCQLSGVPPVAQVRRIDGELGCSLVCIGSVLSLAVVPTALQKLHKCVT